ncbi:MAG: hypothetical protein AVDCRST_MAG47-1952 [uncultured Nocardioidaceae bacterium]|uniref:Uncharacterized protein n=1 Tax=uncultured Nocardioidaceae bacterium TaxID=253824 RepID=A0A6J4N9A4_9ACTN|nr:MAG: hypothetical protein AVDCRST_MAG47-1952 [uncultured Nocardioidaceae bacterium]
MHLCVASRSAPRTEGARAVHHESVSGVVDTITGHEQEGGLHFIDFQNRTVPW